MWVLRGILHLIWRILVGHQAMWGGVLDEWGASGDTIAEKNLQSLGKDEKVLYDMQVHENPGAHCTTRPPHLTASAWAWAGSHVLVFFQCVSDNESLVFRKAFKLDAVLKRLSRTENVWLWNAVLCQFEAVWSEPFTLCLVSMDTNRLDYLFWLCKSVKILTEMSLILGIFYFFKL